MTALSTTPADVDMTPRNMKFNLDDALGKDWHDNDPFKTAFFNAMSILFPIGEKHFIDSVAKFADQVTDEKLLAEVRKFTIQEAMHTREHRKFNQRLCQLRGYDLDRMEARLTADQDKLEEELPPIVGLYSTVAYEHFTAIMADRILRDTRILEGSEPSLASMWRWHAFEETEHKAVAFDVLSAAGGTHDIRKKTMRLVTLRFSQHMLFNINHMLKTDGYSFFQRLKIWSGGIRWLFGREGFLRSLKNEYLDYFKAGFHPWQHDNRELLVSFEKEIEALAA
ncbi:MAG: metal-dependent hydrolase [Parvibaculaceae bacterium]|nr:metal-dependent hydrolase [Parvibaculaceae bacterium]